MRFCWAAKCLVRPLPAHSLLADLFCMILTTVLDIPNMYMLPFSSRFRKVTVGELPLALGCPGFRVFAGSLEACAAITGSSTKEQRWQAIIFAGRAAYMEYQFQLGFDLVSNVHLGCNDTFYGSDESDPPAPDGSGPVGAEIQFSLPISASLVLIARTPGDQP